MSSPKYRIKVALRNGNERLLEYNGNALAEAEDLLGCKVIPLIQGIAGGDDETVVNTFGFKQIRDLLYCGIRGAGGKYTRDQVGDLMHTDGESFTEYLKQILMALTIAINGSLPEAGEPVSGLGEEPSSNPLQTEPETGIGRIR